MRRSKSRSQGVRAILLGGSIAGVLDITYAFVFYGSRGVRPIRILQSIAGGLLGARAYKGGLGTAALGLGLHFLIALGAATVYYAASRKLTFLRRRAVVSGLLYGIAVYLFMNLIVIPLSAFPRGRFSMSATVTGVIVHMLFIGLPISLAVRHYSK